MDLDDEGPLAGVEFRLVHRRRLLVEAGGIGQIAGAGQAVAGDKSENERGGERDTCLESHDTSLDLFGNRPRSSGTRP